MDHRIVGMHILAVLIQDINSPTAPRNSAKFRKAGMPLTTIHWTTIINLIPHSLSLFSGGLS